EYYLTDVMKILKKEGEKIETMLVKNRWETEGINSTLELKQMEEYISNKKIESGVNKLSLTKK
ncbi:MAG: hypothetical protein Q8N71_06050, partial [candidate division Zixibacteria bacterium]|nr:hypothetical protein [candidate division Zixibacteria bacterium]